jgi:hypothetical protein
MCTISLKNLAEKLSFIGGPQMVRVFEASSLTDETWRLKSLHDDDNFYMVLLV